MRRILTIMAVAVAALIMAVSPASSAPQPSASRPALAVGVLLPKDFNFDAQDDLAIGAPGEDVGAIAGAGAVTIIYGKDRLPAQTVRQGAGGVAGAAERGDRFGTALARGYFNDFNEDGLADLAVGVPGEDVGGAVDAGAVNILYGSPAGLTGGPLLTESPPRAGAHFGAALATGDFNGDRRGDLVIAAPMRPSARSLAPGRSRSSTGRATPGWPSAPG
jgi:FG-GAP repeat